MYIQTDFIYGSGIVVVCMLLLLLIATYLYFRVNKALSNSKKEFTQYKSATEVEAKKALDDARRKALEIIYGTNLFTAEIKKNFEQAVQKSVDSGASTYKSLLSEVENKTASQLMEVNKSLKEEATHEIQNIAKTVNTEAQALSGQMKETVENEKKQYLADMNKSKEQALLELKTKVIGLLPKVLEDTITNSLSPSDQEKLAINAINKIKNQHGL